MSIHLAPGAEPAPLDPELLRLRRFRVRIEALLAEPGHITRAEVQAALADSEDA
jgi:hypothetical protein